MNPSDHVTDLSDMNADDAAELRAIINADDPEWEHEQYGELSPEDFPLYVDPDHYYNEIEDIQDDVSELDRFHSRFGRYDE